MKQLLLIERSELNTLRAGGTLTLTLSGGQQVAIGLEGRNSRKPGTQYSHKVTPDMVEKMKAMRKQGLSDLAIGERLGVSGTTVRDHVGNRKQTGLGGRRTPLSAGAIKQIRASKADGATVAEIAKRFKVAKRTVWRYTTGDKKGA